MVVEKRAHLFVNEVVLVTKENILKVAIWCNGKAEHGKIVFEDTTLNMVVTDTAFIGDYVEKRSDGFRNLTAGFVESWLNRNEKGELLDD